MASNTAGTAQHETAPEPLLAITLPLQTRIRFTIRAWITKALTTLYFGFRVWRNPLPRHQWPTLTKRYAVVPELKTEARVFIPKTWKSGDPPLPLVVDIHGGGFMIGHPCMDDAHNATLSEHGFVVVAVPYRLSPTAKFPTHSLDVAAQIRAVIDDQSLPIDRSKVAVTGFSAGGNLALSATQLHGLDKEVKAVVAWYPATDLGKSTEEKLQTRISNGKPDMLASLSPMFNWSYVRPGTNRNDPVLSPSHASRDKLPANLYIIGCEHDLLRQEALDFAEKMAANEPGEKKPTAQGAGWEKGSVRWELVKGEIHGFNQVPAGKAETARRTQRATELTADVAAWLHKVFA